MVAPSFSSAAAVLGQQQRDTHRVKEDSWLFVLIAAAGVATAFDPPLDSSITRLDEARNHSDDNDDDDEEDSEDPYDNLPEEDEPTHCSICLTYRQGPCRPYWRKVEACTKDNELMKKDQQETKNQEGDTSKEATKEGDEQTEENEPDPRCFKYMLPWIDCATGFRNLYSLIELDTNYTAGIADLEKEAVETLCWAPGKEPKIDWVAWKTYVLAHEDWKLAPKRKRSKTDKGASPSISLWKTLDQSQDPEVVEITATVPSTEGVGILECTYAVDQDGNVLGFSYGTKPSEAAKQSDAGESEEKDDPVELKIRLLPTLTRRIIIKASYTQPKKKGAKEDAPLDAHLYQSRYYSLKKMTEEDSRK